MLLVKMAPLSPRRLLLLPLRLLLRWVGPLELLVQYRG